MFGLGSPLQAATDPFNDDFEGGTAAWTVDGTWALTVLKSRSATHSATDSAGMLYTNNTDSALTLAFSLDLSSATLPGLLFHQQTSLEDSYDFGHVDVSTNGGASWATPLASYTGNRGTWTREQLDLSAYAGSSDVRVRFRLETDASVIGDGWYIDDVLIDEAPLPPTSLLVTNLLTTSLELRWTPSASPDVAGYRVYRSRQDGEIHLVGEVPGAASTNRVDGTVNPKTTCSYRVTAVDADGMETPSADVKVIRNRFLGGAGTRPLKPA